MRLFTHSIKNNLLKRKWRNAIELIERYVQSVGQEALRYVQELAYQKNVILPFAMQTLLEIKTVG